MMRVMPLAARRAVVHSEAVRLWHGRSDTAQALTRRQQAARHRFAYALERLLDGPRLGDALADALERLLDWPRLGTARLSTSSARSETALLGKHWLCLALAPFRSVAALLDSDRLGSAPARSAPASLCQHRLRLAPFCSALARLGTGSALHWLRSTPLDTGFALFCLAVRHGAALAAPSLFLTKWQVQVSSTHGGSMGAADLYLLVGSPIAQQTDTSAD